MPNIKRPTIAWLAAIAGVQTVNVLLNSHQPAQSSSCLQWAGEAITNAAGSLSTAQPEPRAEMGYYDVRTKQNVQLYAPGTAPVAPAPEKHSAIPQAEITVAEAAPTATDADATLQARVDAINAEVMAGTYKPAGTQP